MPTMFSQNVANERFVSFFQMGVQSDDEIISIKKCNIYKKVWIAAKLIWKKLARVRLSLHHMPFLNRTNAKKIFDSRIVL